MNTIQGQITTFTIPEKNKQESDVTGVIKKYIYHWPLFLLAVLIFMPLAYFYASKMLPIYEIKASIIIKDGKKTQEPNSSALHEIDLINSSKIIENEIEILKSRKLITQVVKDLNLWVNYQKKDGLKKIDLYDKSPVKLLLVKQDEELDNQKLNIIIKSKDKFDLLMPSGQYKTFSFNKIYKNSFGSWKLVTTENLDKFYGQSMQIGLAGYENLALGYQKLIDASLSNKLSTAVVLTITDQVPQRGKDILNSLIVNYNLETSKDKNKNVENTISFLDQKIASLSGELGRTEKNIEGFKSSRGLTEISLQSKVSLENLQANDAKLNDANVQLDVIKGIDNYVNSASNAEKVPSANGINEPALSNSIDKLSKLQLQYEELAATTPETSPDFEPINRQIKSTKSTIKEIVSNIKQSVTGTRNKLQAYNSRFESSIKNLPAQERQYVDIKRNQSSKESLYTYYLQKRQEAGANYTSTLKDDKVIDEAYAGMPKSGKMTTFAFAFFLSLGLPTALIFTRNALNNKVINADEIKDIVDIPIIAELSLERSDNSIAIKEKFTSAMSEQIRGLRTKLHYLHKPKEKGRVTLITSSIPGEGKSFLSTNLAVALAYTERKTIILELDMRKPKIAEAFSLEKGHAGLSDYFERKVSIESIIQDSGILPNLQIISSGSEIYNPSELLEREELSHLLAHLRYVYDDIIIDSPPAHLVPDATIVSPLSDLCLYIVRQGFTEKSELKFLNTLIEQEQLSKVNIVFNGIEQNRYGYGYSYNNNYYNNQKKSFFSNVFGDFKSRF